MANEPTEGDLLHVCQVTGRRCVWSLEKADWEDHRPEYPVSLHGSGNRYYVLRDGEPVATDLLTYGYFLEHNFDRCVVEKTRLIEPDPELKSEDDRYGGGVEVSTVFLGLDHNFHDEGPPILFETMIFGGPLDQDYQERYETRLQAEAGHRKAVEVARQALEEMD